MKKSKICLLVFLVVFALCYSQIVPQSTITVTINAPPSITDPSITPSTVYLDTDVNCTTTFMDANGGTGTVNFNWYVNDVGTFSESFSGILSGSSATSTFSSSSYDGDDVINCTAYANDGTDNSTSKSVAKTVIYYATEVNCTNNVDDDGDGAVDYGDSDCSGCIDFSDFNTYQGVVVNSSGQFYINGNVTLCPNTYTIDTGDDEGAIIINASNIYLDCNGAELNGVDDEGYGIYNDGKDYVNVSNCTIYDYEWGIYLYNDADHGYITDNTAFSNHDGVYGMSSPDNTFVDNNFSLNSYSGFYLWLDCDHSIFTNNIANSNGNYGIRLESHADDVLTGNTANSNVEGIALYSCDNQVLTDNTMNLNSGYGIYVWDSDENVLTNNDITFNGGTGLGISSSSNSNFTNNDASLNGVDGIILQYDADNNIFTNNTFNSNDDDGIYLINSSFNTFTNNTANLNGKGIVLVLDSNDNIFTNNPTNSNTEEGIRIETSSGNNFTNNTINSNTGPSIYLQNAASNTFTHNDVDSNAGEEGIYLVGNSTENLFVDTVLTMATDNDYYAIYLMYTSVYPDNNVFNDTLIYNTSNYLLTSESFGQDHNNTFNNLTLSSTQTLGMVNWQALEINNVDLTGANFKLDPAFVSLDSTNSSAQQLNVSANITISVSDCSDYIIYKLAGFPVVIEDILASGSLYVPSYSLCSNNEVTFTVEGFSGYAALLAEVCNNGADDDGDGYTDCNDPDCDDSAYCAVTSPIESSRFKVSKSTVCAGEVEFTVTQRGTDVNVDDVDVYIDGEKKGNTNSGIFSYDFDVGPHSLKFVKDDYDDYETTYSFIECDSCDCDSNDACSDTEFCDGCSCNELTCPEGFTALGHFCQPLEECNSNVDCAYNQLCIDNLCEIIPCDCGQVINKVCISYECCKDSDCSQGSVCVENGCYKLPEYASHSNQTYQTAKQDLEKMVDTVVEFDSVDLSSENREILEMAKEALQSGDYETAENLLGKIEQIPDEDNIDVYTPWVIIFVALVLAIVILYWFKGSDHQDEANDMVVEKEVKDKTKK